jgi:excisionase family DNA binding protein
MITNPFDLIDTRLSNIESILLDFRHSVSQQTPPKQEDSSRLYGDRSVAKHLGCTVQTINQLKKSGKLPFHRVGRKYYYIQSEVDQAFMGNTHKFKK